VLLRLLDQRRLIVLSVVRVFPDERDRERLTLRALPIQQ